jgi:hypothetical protein
VSLEDFLEDKVVDIAEPQARRPRTDGPSSPSPTLHTAYPWLRDFLSTTTEGGGLEPASGSGPCTAPEVEPLDEAEMEAVFEILEAKRAKLSAEAYEPPTHFHTSILGGAWTASHHGLPYDNFKAYCSGAQPTEWCRRHFGIQQATFAIRKFGDEAAAAMALYWCHRMEYFYGLGQPSWPAEYSYTASDRMGAPMLADMPVFAKASAWPDACKARLQDLEALVPGSMGSAAASSSGA